MHDRGSLCEVAFRYARWLRETGQWEAMDLFTGVIHPAVGRLAGDGKSEVTDITPDVIRRTLAVAERDRIDPELAAGAWDDFAAFLDAEGIAHELGAVLAQAW